MSEIQAPPADPAKPRTRRQDPTIQALRGIAVILMVAGHVIGTRNHGIRVGDDSLWHFSYVALADIRMPLFTLISGYVYAMVPVTRWRDYPRIIRGKSRRLLLPLITVGTFLYVVKRMVPGLNTDVHNTALWRVYVFRFEDLWFLQSIFVIFLVVGILDSSGLLSSRARWFTATALATTTFFIVRVPTNGDVLTISRALYLLPFFLLGYGMRRHSLFDLRRATAAVGLIAFAGVYTIRLLTIFGVYHPDQYVERVISVGVAATALVLIYSARNVLHMRWLAWVGGFSFGIYLLHVFATASSRLFLEHFGVHGDWELFVVGLLIGVSAPIVFQLAFGNVAVIRTFVLGESHNIGWHSARRLGAADKLNGVTNGTPGRFPGRSGLSRGFAYNPLKSVRKLIGAQAQ
jgi:acyltransferase